MRTLAYIMLSNLYPVTNLTTLSGPRTIFLYDLSTHKKIDICGHIYYLLTKSITKRNLRTILQFPSLIIALIAKTRLKIPSGLTIIQRDYWLVLKRWPKAKPTSPDQKLAFLKSQATMLRKKVGKQKKKLIGTHQPQRALHNHPPNHKHRDPTVLIVSLQELSRCMEC